jgi:hypothetical protein
VAAGAVYQAPETGSSDEIVKALLAPASTELGRYLGEHLRAKLYQNDSANARSHIEAVRDKTGNDGKSVDDSLFRASTVKAEKLRDWAEGAASIDEAEAPLEAAAWRAALEEIIFRGDDHLLQIVKSLDYEAIEFLLQSRFDSQVPEKLMEHGLLESGLNLHRLARQAYFSLFVAMGLAVYIYIGLIFVVGGIDKDASILSLSGTFAPKLILGNIAIVARDYGSILTISILITFSGAFALGLSRLSRFRLTSRGAQIKEKIEQYRLSHTSKTPRSN